VNQEFKQCLETKKIVSFARGKKLVKKELQVARNDLSDAKAGYENERLYTPGATVKRATTAWL